MAQTPRANAYGRVIGGTAAHQANHGETQSGLQFTVQGGNLQITFLPGGFPCLLMRCQHGIVVPRFGNRCDSRVHIP